MGVWFIYPDGSGAWVRRDRRADRFQTLRGAGPDAIEITARYTVCSTTRQEIAPPTANYAYCKDVAAQLPGTVPRDVLTIFTFKRTSKRIADGATEVATGTPIIKAIINSVLQ